MNNISISPAKLLSNYDDEDVKLLIGYLPIKISSFFNNDDYKYYDCIAYIAQSYTHNLGLGTPYPYFFYYQLFITYLYKVFHVYKTCSVDINIQKAIQDFITDKLEEKKNYYNDMFDLSNVGEDEFISWINIILRCLKRNHIADMKSLVVLRNHVAHVWGEFAEEEKYDNHIAIIKRSIELINPKIIDFVSEKFRYILEGNILDKNGYDDFIVFGYNDIVGGIHEIIECVFEGTIISKSEFIKAIYTLQIYIGEDFKSDLYLEIFEWLLQGLHKDEEIYPTIEGLGGIYSYILDRDINLIIEIISLLDLSPEDKELSINFLKNAINVR